jgi:hypothetical protein
MLQPTVDKRLGRLLGGQATVEIGHNTFKITRARLLVALQRQQPLQTGRPLLLDPTVGAIVEMGTHRSQLGGR